MTGRTESGRQEPRDTLLLYCPYDRRVTRHARRGDQQTVVCLECGRAVDGAERESSDVQAGAYEQRTARQTPVVEPPAARRSQARPRPQRTRPGWVPVVIAGAALIVGALAVVNVAGNLTAPQETVVPVPRQGTSAQGAPSAQPRQTSEATLPAPSVEQPQFVRIANTGGEGAFVRRTTNLDDRVRAWPDSTQLRVLGPDASANGVQWKHVQDPAGNEGWIPSEYTRPE